MYDETHSSAAQKMPMEFVFVNYQSNAILKTILKILYAKYWDVSCPI